MDIAELDLRAFEFVGRLSALTESDIPNWGETKNEEKFQGDGVEPIIELDEIQGFALSSLDQQNGKEASRHKDIDGTLIGLNTTAYSELSTLLEEVAFIPQFANRCSLKFLIDNTFEWLLSTYTQNKTGITLSGYLLDKIAEETRPYTFHYKLNGMAITDSIEVGNAIIAFISDEDIDRYRYILKEKKPEADIAVYEPLYQMMGGMAVKVTVESTYEMAKNMALRDAELAVSILKCFLSQYCLHQYHSIPDFEYKSRLTKQFQYLSFTERYIPNQANFENIAGFIPLKVGSAFFHNARINGMDKVSTFIKQKANDELSETIVHTIERFGKIVSTFSHHEKIAKSISLFEAVILPWKENKGKGKSENTMINYVVPKLTNKQDAAISALKRSYRIRDKYVHNSLELEVNVETLWTLLEIIRKFILQLITLHNSGKRELNEVEQFYKPH